MTLTIENTRLVRTDADGTDQAQWQEVGLLPPMIDPSMTYGQDDIRIANLDSTMQATGQLLKRDEGANSVREFEPRCVVVNLGGVGLVGSKLDWSGTPTRKQARVTPYGSRVHLEAGSLFERIATSASEKGDLAADFHNFGSIKSVEDIRYAKHLGQHPAFEQYDTNLIPQKLTEPRRAFAVIGEDGGTSFFKRIDPDKEYVDGRANIASLNEELELLRTSTPNAIERYIAQRTEALRDSVRRDAYFNIRNIDMIFNGYPMPSVTKNAKLAFEKTSGSTTSWIEWLTHAPDEQVVNFSQWYIHTVEPLTTTDGRRERIDSLKTQYMARLEGAVADGWLRADHIAKARKNLDKARVFFFSPFGKTANSFGGAVESKDLERTIINLPSITSEHVANHEFGHIFNGFDAQGLAKYWVRHKYSDKGMRDAYTAINEGYNEHITVALAKGHPDLIDTKQRAEAGITPVDGESNAYRAYRDFFAVLVAGDQAAPSFSEADMTAVVDSIHNFKNFQAFLAKRWSGQDVLSSVLMVFTEMVGKKGEHSGADVEKATEYLHNLRAGLVDAV